MVTYGYFHGAGYTEIRALLEFLRKVRPDVRWQRLFPAAIKPGPKPKGHKHGTSAPSVEHSGTTGSGLRAAALHRIRSDLSRGQHYAGYVLLDDADCRFCEAPVLGDATHQWSTEWATDVAALGTTGHAAAIFASPEIEAWFLVDPDVRRPWLTDAEHAVRTRLGSAFDHTVEQFGCPRVLTSCSRKLSDEIASELRSAGRPYSKAIQGPALLMEVSPDTLAKRLPSTVGRAVHAIRAWR